jgi:GH15 family glucan-1,4-alpha-glucosidase
MAQAPGGGVRARWEGAEPRYWAIEDYGVIGDCRTAALVAPNGSIDWLCLPHFDSQAALCKLVDADHGGYFQVRPQLDCDAAMRYLPASNMLETTFTSETGQVKALDFMPIRKRRPHERVLAALNDLTPTTPHHQRAHLERDMGNDVAAAHRIDRIISCEHGVATITISLKVTPDFAQRHARYSLHVQYPRVVAATLHDDERQRYLVFVAKPMSGAVGTSALGEFEVSVLDGRLQASIQLQAGQRIGVALNFARDEAEAQELLQRILARDLDDDVAETLNYWQTWADQCAYSGAYADAVLRSALALKLCTFEPSGAMVAAPTTSLPEKVGGERNWDYRFTWLRDSSFTLQALGLLGYHSEARDFFHFLHDLGVSEGSQFRVLYTLRGESDGATKEQELTRLEGYKGSRPVRIGNAAAEQRQMDIYGELADAALRYAEAEGYARDERSHESPRDLRHLASIIADFVADHWQDLDNGIWEERGPQRAFVYSRAMCWVAMDRALRITGGHVSHERTARWSDVARQIRDDIDTNGYNDQIGAFTQAYGIDAVDSANFRLALVGYLPTENERLRDTITTTGRILSAQNALVYRYLPAGDKPEQSGANANSDDGLSGNEGAFLACAFWYVSALAMLDKLDEARERFERLMQFASPLGLYSEEVDANTGALLGNYPQAYTHIGLVIAAHHLYLATQRAEKAAREGQEGQTQNTSDSAS